MCGGHGRAISIAFKSVRYLAVATPPPISPWSVDPYYPETRSSLPFSGPLLAPLYPFSELVTPDLNTFCTSDLDDVAYAHMAMAWPVLRRRKVGVADVSRVKQVVTTSVAIAVLVSCVHLHTLQIVFDASILSLPLMTLAVDMSAQLGNRVSVEQRKGWPRINRADRTVGFFEPGPVPNSCWEFACWGGRGRPEKFGGVPDISGAAAEKIQSSEVAER